MVPEIGHEAVKRISKPSADRSRDPWRRKTLARHVRGRRMVRTHETATRHRTTDADVEATDPDVEGST